MKQFLKAKKISESVYWVGAIDWGIRDFHGYATRRGTTYNAYLIMADKITLVDCVKAPFKDEMLARIASVVDIDKIDYIISNHAEMDHSGALPEVLKEAKPEKLFASPMGIKALEAHFDLDMEITPVKTGDELSLGNKTLSFIETRMLHWPDSMFTYLKEEEILFTQDAFGLHFATGDLFVDENDITIVKRECEKYFANILMPFASKIKDLLASVEEMNIPIKIAASDHGPIFRDADIATVLNWYAEWAEQPRSKKAVIVYDTMWGSTATMGNAIADGVSSTGCEIKVIPLASSDRSEVATEMLEAGAFIVGSPTINNQIFPSLADILTYLKGLKPHNLIGAAFGSFGWSGESVKQVNQYLQDMDVELLSDGIKCKYVPREDDLKKCFELGVEIGEKLNSE